MSKMKPESQRLTGQPRLSLQKSFILIRGRKDDSDQGGQESLQRWAWLEFMGPFWMGFGEVELGKCHLAHKLDVKLTHTYSSVCLGTSTSLLPSRNTQSNQDLLVPACPPPTPTNTKLGGRGVGEYLGALLFWSGHFTSLGSRSLPLFFPPDHFYSVSSSVTALWFLWT